MSTFKSYLLGYIISISLTLGAYIPVRMHFSSAHRVFSHEILIGTILTLAVAQMLVQLIFFLHMGREQKPRWNLAAFLSTVSIVLVIVIGSLWIMGHLNYNMTPQQMNEHLLENENFQK